MKQAKCYNCPHFIGGQSLEKMDKRTDVKDQQMQSQNVNPVLSDITANS